MAARFIQPNNDLQLRCGDHAASSTRLSHSEQDENASRDHPGKEGRRHEVNFGDAPHRVEIYASDETVEIFVRQILKPMRRNGDASRFWLHSS